MSIHRVLPALLTLLFVSSSDLLAANSAQSPNVVFILTDNHGAWTLGCYGNEEIRTPHIDRLAAEGTLMTRAFSSNPVCSPTRATFLTGLMPSQHGVHCFLRGGRLQVGPQAKNTLEEFQSLPEILKSNGYRCGLVGKWHLGGNMSSQESLDDYWITMPHGGTSTFYNAKIIENGAERTEPKYLTEFWTDHAVNFIKQKDERPFFLYLAYNGPYSLSRLLLREGQNRHAEHYRNVDLKSFPNEKPHPWQYNNLDYMNNPISNRRVATEVSGVDDGVGRVMATLKEMGLDENTIVVFAADQGWAGGHGGFYGMGDHTRPVTATDEMMQIPMIFRHPNGVKAGQRSDLMVSNYDLMSTLVHYLGFEKDLTNNPISPGRDFSALLRGKSITKWAAEVFYEFEFLRCLRTDAWKLVRRHPHGPDELYDLKNDPGEQANLIGQTAVGSIQKQLDDRLQQFFEKYNLPKYDLLNGGGAQTVVFNPPSDHLDEEAAQTEHLSQDPFDKSDQIQVPDGYIVEKVASSALVQHPMMAGFDDRGRLFVAESAGQNLRSNELEVELPNSVKMLEDTNGDGTFDKVTVFADDMTLPMGACWYRDALYVASPPHIWRLQDTDDDGVADVREKLPAKFGYSGNAASVHGCFLSPEGRIYWCDGRHGHELEDEEGNVTSTRSGSYIFSCWPDGSDLQVHCGGGMDNPVEVDFTDSGDVLGTVNILYRSPRIDCLVHWLHGGAYPHSERVLGELPRTGDLLGPVHQFGHVAVSGTTRYRSGILNRDFTDNMFVTIFNTGQIIRVSLEESGSTYKSRQHEFLTCSDPDFHPTDVLEDADGSLLLVDTGGWFRIGCPTSQIAKPDIKGGIYRIRRQGMPSYVDPRGLHIDWASLSNQQLTNLLNDTRYAVRERAIEECSMRGDAIVDSLNSIVTRGDIRVRQGAAWALTRVRTESAQKGIRSAFTDRDATVRAIACKSAGVTKDKLAVEGLIQRLGDESRHVRRAALTALGKIGDAAAVPAILNHASQLTDRSEDHALIYALMEINAPEQIKQGLAAKHSETRRTALIALHQIAPESLDSANVMQVIAAGGPGVMHAALNILEQHPDWDAAVADLLTKWISGGVEIELDSVQSLVAEFASTASVQRVLPHGIHALQKDPNKFVALMSGVGDSALKQIPESWCESWSSALASDQHAISRAALTAARDRQHPFGSQIEQISTNESLPADLRLAAAEALPPGPISEKLFASLGTTIDSGTPPEHVERAIALLGRSQLTASQQKHVAQLIPGAGPLELQGWLKVVQRAGDDQARLTLANALAMSRSRKTLAASQVQQLSKGWSSDAKQPLQSLLDELQAMEADQVEKLNRLEPLVRSASAVRGRDVFFSEKAKCATCHRVEEKGGKIGPDLSGIGRIRRERDLLEAILFPSKSFAREYEPYTIATSDGKVLSGLISRETEDELFIQQTTGDPVAIARDDIENMAPAAVSVMPQGLETGLSEQQLADLVAYLRSLTSAPAN